MPFNILDQWHRHYLDIDRRRRKLSSRGSLGRLGPIVHQPYWCPAEFSQRTRATTVPGELIASLPFQIVLFLAVWLASRPRISADRVDSGGWDAPGGHEAFDLRRLWLVLFFGYVAKDCVMYECMTLICMRERLLLPRFLR